MLQYAAICCCYVSSVSFEKELAIRARYRVRVSFRRAFSGRSERRAPLRAAGEAQTTYGFRVSEVVRGFRTAADR
eukprot:668153-Prorocentrum_minimum.AAC.1